MDFGERYIIGPIVKKSMMGISFSYQTIIVSRITTSCICMSHNFNDTAQSQLIVQSQFYLNTDPRCKINMVVWWSPTIHIFILSPGSES